jgi:replicative DNA helicase
VSAVSNADGRVPPHDLEAEAAVLSACMLRGDSAAVDEVSAYVSAEDFYSEAHRRTFEAIVDLASRGEPVDSVQIGGWLKDHGRLSQMGGMAYLGKVLDAAPFVTTKHLVAYARRVRNRARMRKLVLALQVATIQLYAGVPDEATEGFFAKLEEDVGAITASQHQGELVAIGPVAKRVMSDLREHHAKGGGILGIATGFPRLDDMTGGLHDGDLTIIAARPGLGKTSFVMGVCDNITERDYAGVIFSLEMPKEQLTMRLLCSRQRVMLSKTRTGKLSPEEWTRLTLEADLIFPRWIHIDDTPSQTWPMIKSKLRRHKALCLRHDKKLGVAIIDFLQLLKTRERKGGVSRSELIGEIARDAKATAKELGIPIVLLSQLNREVEKRPDKRPVMSDVRDSGEIEEAADNVILLYRDDYYYEDSDEKNLAEIIIGKQRNGPVGVVKVGFDKEWTRFFNLAAYDDEPPPQDDGVPYERPRTEPEQQFFTTEDL